MSVRQKGTRVGEGGAVELPPGHVRKTRDFLTTVKIQGGFTSVLLRIQKQHSKGQRVLALETEALGVQGNTLRTLLKLMGLSC